MPDPGLPHYQKTGEQLLSMFRQLIVVGHGLIPTKDWEAMIAYVAWADMLWEDSYTGFGGLLGGRGICLHVPAVLDVARVGCRSPWMLVAYARHMPCLPYALFLTAYPWHIPPAADRYAAHMPHR